MGRTEGIAQFNGRIENDGHLYLQQGLQSNSSSNYWAGPGQVVFFLPVYALNRLNPGISTAADLCSARRSGSVQRFQPCRLFERLCPVALVASGCHATTQTREEYH